MRWNICKWWTISGYFQMNGICRKKTQDITRICICAFRCVRHVLAKSQCHAALWSYSMIKTPVTCAFKMLTCHIFIKIKKLVFSAHTNFNGVETVFCWNSRWTFFRASQWYRCFQYFFDCEFDIFYFFSLCGYFNVESIPFLVWVFPEFRLLFVILWISKLIFMKF